MNDLEPKPSISRSQWKLIFLILAVSAGSVMYRLIVLGRLEQTAVLFVGIPTVLAILLAVVPKAKTVKGGITKGLTLFLLLSGPLLGEGFICILMVRRSSISSGSYWVPLSTGTERSDRQLSRAFC